MISLYLCYKKRINIIVNKVKLDYKIKNNIFYSKQRTNRLLFVKKSKTLFIVEELDSKNI